MKFQFYPLLPTVRYIRHVENVDFSAIGLGTDRLVMLRMVQTVTLVRNLQNREFQIVFAQSKTKHHRIANKHTSPISNHILYYIYLENVVESIKNDRDNLDLFDLKHVTEWLEDANLDAVGNLLRSSARCKVCDDPNGLLLAFEVTLKQNTDIATLKYT